MTQSQSVLVIDDASDIHDLIRVHLRPEGVRLHHAEDADAGLALAQAERPDLILLDLDMPGRSGLELCRLVKDDPDLAAIPVVFLTGTTDVPTKVRAFDAGASDYITKPFDAVELRARVRAALRTKRYHDMLATCALLDGLTGLWNRAYFDERLAAECHVAVRHGRGVALVLVDVDHFKRLNDTHGHPFGDDVLRQVGQVLSGEMRQGDHACRYGGEEFALILRETDLAGARTVAERVRARIEALALRRGATPVPVTASLGVAAGLTEPARLIQAADEALYAAKHGGRNRVAP